METTFKYIHGVLLGGSPEDCNASYFAQHEVTIEVAVRVCFSNSVRTSKIEAQLRVGNIVFEKLRACADLGIDLCIFAVILFFGDNQMTWIRVWSSLALRPTTTTVSFPFKLIMIFYYNTY